jgi:hypothetical protein
MLRFAGLFIKIKMILHKYKYRLFCLGFAESPSLLN